MDRVDKINKMEALNAIIELANFWYQAPNIYYKNNPYRLTTCFNVAFDWRWEDNTGMEFSLSDIELSRRKFLEIAILGEPGSYLYPKPFLKELIT